MNPKAGLNSINPEDQGDSVDCICDLMCIICILLDEIFCFLFLNVFLFPMVMECI